MDIRELDIAVLVPCFNEESTVGKVVRDFRKALPTATVYVYDNASADRTAEVALAAGAVVRHEPQKGKGNVVRRMFADVDADVYVLVDGDGTYDASSAPELVTLLTGESLDMVVGARLMDHESEAFKRGHRFGNWAFTTTVKLLFGGEFTDMLSGFRAFSRRFVKSFPALATGFETETELTIHALELRMPIGEVQTRYKSRGEGSDSKLSTYGDGLRILAAILLLFKDHRPLQFFLILFTILLSASLALGYPIVVEYVETGLVPRFPTAILATGVMILAFLSLASGFVLDSVIRGRREMKRLLYLSVSLIRPPGTSAD